MEAIEIRTPTLIGNIEIRLYDLVILPEDDAPQQATFEIGVLDEEGQPVRRWTRQGNLVPYLDDASTYLTTADRAYLIDLLARIRQEATLRVLGA